MWGAVIGAAASLIGGNRQAKRDARNQREAAEQNRLTVQSMLGDMELGREQVGQSYDIMKGYAGRYADWAEEEPWRIAQDMDAARKSYTQYGETALSSVTEAMAQREGFGRESLGRVSQATALIERDQKKALDMQTAQLDASGLTGSAKSAQQIQLQATQGEQLQNAALEAGRETAGITQQMGRDIMGLQSQKAGMEMGMGGYLGNMGVTETGMLAGARGQAAGANRAIGGLELERGAAMERNLSAQAGMRMNVQHQAAPTRDTGAAWGAIGSAIGGMDWGSMFGGGGGGGATPQTASYQAGFGVGPYQTAAPDTQWNPYATPY